MIEIPPGSSVTLTMQAGQSYIIVAPPGANADLDVMRQPGGMVAIFTHDPGLCWTDRAGERMATAFLARGFPCIFEFARLGDAMKCKARLEPATRH